VPSTLDGKIVLFEQYLIKAAAYTKKRVLFFSVLGACLVVLLLWILPARQVHLYKENWIDKYYWTDKFDDEKRANFDREMFKIENELRGNYAQIIGGFVLLVGLYLTWRKQNHEERTSNQTLRLTEDGKITERYSKAIELLGSDNLAMRIGGIYALERIARDSQKDHWTVMEALCAFIRDESNKVATTAQAAEQPPTSENGDKQATDSKNDTEQPKLRSDIQIALTVIGRRSWVDEEKEQGLSLDLSGADLTGADLTGADLTGADLNEADLSHAILIRATLYDAKLSEANLSGASLTGAYLSGAYLRKADLNKADLTEADLSRANLTEANLSEANLSEANLSGADLTGAECDECTQFPEGFDLARLKPDTNEGTE
jgi:uncharacterized protein YjbI with pentapeptide repeats